MGPKLSMQDQIRSIDAGKSQNILMSRRQPKIHLHGQISGISSSLRRAELESREIYAAQIRNTWNCRTSCTTSERRNFGSIGSLRTAKKLAGRSYGVKLLSPKCARLSCRCPELCERRFNSPFGGPIIPFEVECISLAQKSFLGYSLGTP